MVKGKMKSRNKDLKHNQVDTMLHVKEEANLTQHRSNGSEKRHGLEL